ncbi:MAG: hypothetical protein ACK5JQ_01975 [Bacteroidota bacterium]|jgi:hypothetical protein
MLQIKLFTNDKKWALLLCCLIYSSLLKSQTIIGNLSLLVNQPIKLEGFNGFKTYPISSTGVAV